MKVIMGVLRIRQTSIKLLCLRFHSLAAVNDHESAVDRGENPVRVLREILVPGPIKIFISFSQGLIRIRVEEFPLTGRHGHKNA